MTLLFYHNAANTGNTVWGDADTDTEVKERGKGNSGQSESGGHHFDAQYRRLF